MGAMTVWKPIFIVGCGRSGTTLLFDWLSQHPDLVRTQGYPDGEDHEGWIRHGHCVMAGIGSPGSEKFGNGINGFNACLHMTAEDATPAVRESMHRYYAEGVMGGRQGRRVINKCPHNSNKLGYLLGLFPDAKIVHIIRDCEPTVASWMAIMQAVPSLVVYLPDEEFPCLWLMQRPAHEPERKVLARHRRFYPGGGGALWVDYWCKTNMGIEPQMAGKLDQLISVRYEDLVAAPQAVLDRITSFCGLPANRYVTGGVDRQTEFRHKHLLTADVVRAVETRAQAARRHFGYAEAVDGKGASSRPLRLYLPTKEELLSAAPARMPLDKAYVEAILERSGPSATLGEWKLAPHEELQLSAGTTILKARFLGQALNLDECLKFYESIVSETGGFPPDWEYFILELALGRHPGRADLVRRLAVVRNQLLALKGQTA
jgi:hypothetical protein